LAELPPSVTCASGGCGNPLAFADVKEGETILDMGCGVGMDCFLAAKRVGKTSKVIGISNSSEHIAAGNENKCKVGAGNVEFKLGELENLPLEDESVDVAISNCVGCVSRGKEVVLSGGRLVVSGGVLKDEAPDEVVCEARKNEQLPPLKESKYLDRLRNIGFSKAEIASRRPTRNEHRWRVIIRAVK